MAGLLEQLKRSSRLPSPPGAALQILRLAQQENVSLTEVANVLASDPALSVRILKYANSARTGIDHEITTVREAVVLLGMRTVRMMALSFSLCSQQDYQACPGFNYAQFWARCLAHGVAARQLAATRRGVFPDEAFAAGLLSDIGKLVFAVAMPAEYAEILQQASGSTSEAAALEHQRFGMNHQRAGAELLAEWGIPARLCTAVRYQCNPKDAALSTEMMALAGVVSDARQFVEPLCEGFSSDSPAGALGLSENQDEVLQEMRREFRELADTLSLRSDVNLDVERIQAEADHVLEGLSLATRLRSSAHEPKATLPHAEAEDSSRSKDEVTGLADRAALDLELDKLWRASPGPKRPTSLILLEIDHFKRSAGRPGSRSADAVLREVASRIQKCCRSVDFVARFDTEQFAVILPNADRLIAAGIGVNLRREVQAGAVEVDGITHRVTISLGLAILPRFSSYYTPHVLIEAAHEQMCRAREKGRNCCSMIQLPARVTKSARPTP